MPKRKAMNWNPKNNVAYADLEESWRRRESRKVKLWERLGQR